MKLVLWMFTCICLSTQSKINRCSLPKRYYIVGDTVQISCLFRCHCDNTTVYETLKDNRSLEINDKRITVKEDLAVTFFEIVMTIISVTMSDSGKYGIRLILPPDNEEFLPVSVNVFPAGEPTPVCRSSKQYSIIGDSVTIQCKIFTYLDVKFLFWEQSNLEEIERGYTDKSSSNYDIIFEREFKNTDINLPKNYVVKYKCNLLVNLVVYDCSTDVLIKSRLNVSVTTTDHFTVGENAVLLCFLHNGENTSEVIEYIYTWTSSLPDINMYINGSILILYNVTIELNGTEVTCTVNAHNSEGSQKFIINVIDRPTAITKHSTTESFFSTSLVLTPTIRPTIRSTIDIYSIKTIFIIRSIMFGVFIVVTLAIWSRK